MKRLLPWILLAPFLVCDIDPRATGCLVSVNGAGWLAAGLPFVYDIGSMSMGANRVDVRATAGEKKSKVGSYFIRRTKNRHTGYPSRPFNLLSSDE